MAIFRKKARNLPKFLLKNNDIVDLQLEMWQILPQKNPKIF
jgi:hypothetical protein